MNSDPLTTSGPVLQLSNLTKRFGKNAAVSDVSFQVEEGDIFGFLGPNGAGKSTTIYMIAGLVKPTSGTVQLFGKQNTDVELRRQMGALIEVPAFYEYLSGRRNLQVLARIQGGLPAKRIDEALDRVGLLSRGSDKVGEYSHGMKQRLGIAQTLLHKPRLLLLDEPTNGLDPEGSAQIWELLRSLVRDERMTVFISSHLLHEVEEGCNRIAVINQGILMACDNIRSLLFFSKEDYLLLFDTPQNCDDARGMLSQRQGVEVIAPDEAAEGTSLEPNSVQVRMQQGLASAVTSELASRNLAPRAVIPQRKTLKQFFLELTRRQG